MHVYYVCVIIIFTKNDDNGDNLPFKRYQLRLWDGYVHTAIFKMDNQQGPTV